MKMDRRSFYSLVAGALLSAQAFAGQPAISPEYFSTIRNGDLQQLRHALDHGANANARDEQGNTPLILAAVYADVQAMKLLIEHDADVNAANIAGVTPLIRAAFDFDKTKLLIEHGANVNVRSGMGNTPLILAARPANSHRTVELLLNHGADANATNNWGASALMAAAASSDERLVQLLLEHGANANAQPAMDQPGFIFGGGRSPFMWAAFRGDVSVMQHLVAAGADVNGEGYLGAPLTQATWSDQTKGVKWLIDHGAEVNHVDHGVDYTALHWAASTERRDTSLVNLLLNSGADPNVGGGSHIEAFMDVPQTPLMLARRRGETPVLSALTKAGATNETLDLEIETPAPRQMPAQLTSAELRKAISEAVAPLQQSALISKQNFVKHESRQDCTSCHQQYLPMAAIGFAKKLNAKVDADAEQKLIEIVRVGELKNHEADWQALFHPDGAYTKGYTLFGWAADDQPANELTDSAVHNLAVIQGVDGRWYSNLPRPPIQTSDIGATALAIHALQKYPLPGRKVEFAERVDRARRWLRNAKPANNDERAFQILGLAWAGESPRQLQSLARALIAEQREDGGWSQLPTLKSDAYATGQAIYALRLGANIAVSDPAVDRGRRYLLQTQLEDGSWFVHRRAFPFQPTMKSGFPHGRDGWISAAGTSWAVMALSVCNNEPAVASQKSKSLAQNR
jgi:ankyrin repeat protein